MSWGEEGKKLFIFQKNVCLNSSLALDAEKKPFALKLPEKTDILLQTAVVAVLRKNFKLDLLRAKLTFTAC